MALSETLRVRGLVHQHSSETLEEITDGPKRTVYLGIDPSADSLHVGNLVGLLVLRHFLEDGHKVIILTGGGTGMIGDPGGKSEERNLLDEATVAANAKAVAAQIRKVFGGKEFTEENNASWLSKLDLVGFLRDVGKHFTVNAMIKKDIVRDRLEKESPISFTEFSYSLLQGYDYLHLNREYGCDLQVGGSDQWSNILAGVDFIRRKEDKTVYALTWPLIVNRSTGKKFGKTEGGAIWLDPQKTSPFDFYQFFFNIDDESVGELLLKLTLLPKEAVDECLRDHSKEPAERSAQRKLAFEITSLVHGQEAARQAEVATDVLFGESRELDEAALSAIASLMSIHAVSTGDSLVDTLVSTGLASSKREARQFLEDGAVSLNGASVNADTKLTSDTIRHGAVLRRGKRNVRVLRLK